MRWAVAAAAAAVLFGSVAWAGNTFEGFQVVRVILNGQEVVSDVPAVNFYGRTVLPLRKLAELAGLTIEKWDGESNTVYLTGGGLGQPVATVNGEAVSQGDLYARMVAQNGARALDDLIIERLIDQAARQAGVTVSFAEVDVAIAKISTQLGGDAQLAAALQQNNLSMAQLRMNQEVRLKIVKLITPTIATTDEALQRFFAQNQARFDTRQVHARHILVATEQEAKEIRAQLAAGADFATLAKAKSTDPSAQSNGGDLGTFGLGRMVPEFESVVFGLGKGEISQPFKSAFGWHVAQVLEVSGAAPAFEAQKEAIRAAYLDAQVEARIQPWLQELRAKAQVTNSLQGK